ncbi:MAG: hypothetical protein IH919_01940 [Deltaproteobacteria bacterium]|nr:hypothetical protein [Deltaproteobacteria bacterium]MCH7912779.1 hypothetical protein [Deltaproteobacteria bacterium]MCZ6451636.1 hypothetical protein [Deltaproteobacteria bacterium]MCZ6562859.1 hypothetical protein [Deltaproteobacteria bacterium]
MRWIEIVKEDQNNNPERATDLMYEQYPAMTWEEAEAKEHELAEGLRSKGYAVWQR